MFGHLGDPAVGHFFNGVNQGSVYTFLRTGTNWMPEQQLVAAGGRANDRFGQSVALSGDTLVAGAAGSDVGGGFDQGSAYVFVRDRPSSFWLQQRHLFPDADAEYARRCVALGCKMLSIGLDVWALQRGLRSIDAEYAS